MSVGRALQFGLQRRKPAERPHLTLTEHTRLTQDRFGIWAARKRIKRQRHCFGRRLTQIDDAICIGDDVERIGGQLYLIAQLAFISNKAQCDGLV